MGNDVYHFCNCDKNEITMTKDINEKSLSNPTNSRSIPPLSFSSIYKNYKTQTNQNSQNRTNDLTLTKNELSPPTISLNSSHYIGEYVDNKRHGKGKLILSNNTSYEGDFRNNLYHGKGVLSSPSYIYTGDFLYGKRDGHGKQVDLLKHSTYEGEWVNDLQDGKGEEQYEDGSKYVGMFSKGEKSGIGKLTLKNGSYYEGEFLNDKLHGNGTFIWDKNKNYKGEWNNNEICGYGIMEDENSKHVGYFDKDTKWGLGATMYKGSRVIILGKWENGELDGIGILYNGDWREEKNEKIFIASKGKIVQKDIREDMKNNIRGKEEYINMKKLFVSKLYNDLCDIKEEKDNVIFNFD